MTQIQTDRAATAIPLSEAEVAALVLRGRERGEEASRAQRVAQRGARRAEAERELAAMRDAADARLRDGIARAAGRITSAAESVSRGMRGLDDGGEPSSMGGSAPQAASARAGKVEEPFEKAGFEGARGGLEAYGALEERAAAGHDARAKAHGNHVRELSDEIQELGEAESRSARLGDRALEHLEAFERARSEAARAILRG